MFNLTGSEIVVILLLALVVLGPEKLPDAIRRFGRTYAELRKLGTGFQDEFRAAVDEPMREMRASAEMLRRSVEFGDEPPAGASDTVPTEHLPFSGPDDDGPGEASIDGSPDVPVDREVDEAREGRDDAGAALDGATTDDHGSP